MLLPAPDVSNIPLDGAPMPPVLSGPTDVTDPAGGGGVYTSGTDWGSTLQDILATAADAATQTYIKGSPAVGVPPAVRPTVVTASGLRSGTPIFSNTELLLIGAGLLIVVAIVI